MRDACAPILALNLYPAASLGLVLVLALLGGCRVPVPLVQPEIQAGPPPQAAPPPQSAPDADSVQTPEPVRTLVVVSSEQQSMLSVSQEILRQLAHRQPVVVQLGPDRDLPAEVVEQLSDGYFHDAVAVGIAAGRLLSGVPMERRVFCQVFDDSELVAAGMAGVSMLPSLEGSLEQWRDHSPGLERVLVLVGPDQDEVGMYARAAASKLGMTVDFRVVTSDQEYLLEFRARAPEVQGLMLIPDHRVLSPGVIREVFDTAARRSVEVLAFTPALMDMGAVALGQIDPADVAVQVVNLLEDHNLYQATRGRKLPLSRVRFTASVVEHAGEGHAGMD